MRPLPAGHRPQLLEDVDLFVVEHLRLAGRGGQLQTFREPIDGNHPRGAEQIRALDRELADRAAAPDGNGVVRPMLQFSAAM